MLVKTIIVALLLFPGLLVAQSKVPQDVWEPFKYFVGNWEGTGNGQPGVSKTQREYRFVLNTSFFRYKTRARMTLNQRIQKARSMKTGGS